MKQIAQYQDGRLELQDVPVPVAPPGGVLVRTTHSVISIGTEKMKVEQARMNLLQKARARPDQVRKVLETARNLGWRSALEKVRNRLETPTPLGYSAAGVVTAVDAGNTRFRIGDRVACAGAECAFHAEFLALPDLLVAPVPSSVPNAHAAYTTLASIALQAVRQLEPELGDRVLVMGQGLVGLLVTNLLAASGVRVLAVDLNSQRLSVSTTLGAELTVAPSTQSLPDVVRAWTGGHGVDSVVLCTAGQNNGPLEQAADALRDRGRLVIVGNTRADLAWKVFYEKELDVRYSRSYGPGRYDPAYEWGGQDYPVGYVRWTEQRNFEACLHLMESGRLNLRAITTRMVPFADALAVYQSLLVDGGRDIGVVLQYEGADGGSRPAEVVTHRSEGIRSGVGLDPVSTRVISSVTGVDVVGAGNFARTMLLPHLKDRLSFGTVVNQTALSANHVRAKFGFREASTDAAPVLGRRDSATALLIGTRHHLHAPMVLEALRAGRQVFVEKPLCLTVGELEDILKTASESTGTVHVGFNRRFAPAGIELKQALDSSPGPKTVAFHVFAGRLDPQHWYANHAESGGRVLGEACHFFDFFCFLFESAPVRVTAQTVWPVTGRLPFPDSVTAQVEFADGSCGQLIYTAEGDPSHPKEVCTAYAAGLVARLENFQSLTLHRRRKAAVSRHQSKGHAEQMAAWAGFLRGECSHPLPLAVSARSMRLTFAAMESIRCGAGVGVVA